MKIGLMIKPDLLPAEVDAPKRLQAETAAELNALLPAVLDRMKPKSELILYQTEENRTRIEVRLENETVWLSLNQLGRVLV